MRVDAPGGRQHPSKLFAKTRAEVEEAAARGDEKDSAFGSSHDSGSEVYDGAEDIADLSVGKVAHF